MKKVLEFLENNVQWVVIAIGVLYLGYMAWTFVINSPVSVEVAGEKLAPGDVDKQIYDKPIATLNDKMTRAVDVKLPKLTWAEDFKSSMELRDAKPVELAGKLGFAAPALPSIAGGGTGIEIPGAAAAEPIAKLPTVPPAIMGPLGSGASNVIAPGAPNGVDKNWAIATFKIANKEIATAFAAIKLPKMLYPTAVLEVRLIRQEQKSDGSWSNETQIARLPIEQVLPMPPKDAKIDDLKGFLAWAGLHQKDILQPAFFQWAKGDPITIPTGEAPVAAVPEPAAQAGLPDFDPTRTEYTIEEIRQMTPEQKQQWQKALAEKKKKEQEERKGKRAGQGGGGRGGKGGGAAGGGAGGGRVVDDPDRPVLDIGDAVIDPFNPRLDDVFFPTYFRQDRGGGGFPSNPIPGGGGTPAKPPPGAAPGSPPYGGTPPPQQQPQEGDPAANAPAAEHPAPTGIFDPSESPEHWEGWAFDDTVQAGKTYRYRVVYSIKSPVFNSPNNVQDKALANQLALTSAAAEWSNPVKVAARTSYYVAANLPENAQSVKFQVFAWQGGAKREKTFEVQPGDMIGAMADGVDYSTGATLVDIGRDARTDRIFALVIDANGMLVRRDFVSDKANPEWENDKRAVAAGAAPPAPVAENR